MLEEGVQLIHRIGVKVWIMWRGKELLLGFMVIS
jgi:hypothetical protein